MEYLFKNEIEESYYNEYIKSYFIIDSKLAYVSVYLDNTYKLHYIDSKSISDVVMRSDNESDFDVFVLNQSAPIVSLKSIYDTTGDKTIRIVTVITHKGGMTIRKEKESSERNIVNRFGGNNKLF